MCTCPKLSPQPLNSVFHSVVLFHVNYSTFLAILNIFKHFYIQEYNTISYTFPHAIARLACFFYTVLKNQLMAVDYIRESKFRKRGPSFNLRFKLTKDENWLSRFSLQSFRLSGRILLVTRKPYMLSTMIPVISFHISGRHNIALKFSVALPLAGSLEQTTVLPHVINPEILHPHSESHFIFIIVIITIVVIIKIIIIITIIITIVITTTIIITIIAIIIIIILLTIVQSYLHTVSLQTVWKVCFPIVLRKD